MVTRTACLSASTHRYTLGTYVHTWPSAHKVKAPAVEAIALEVLQPLNDVIAHKLLRRHTSTMLIFVMNTQ
jgi:hypothetical protein